MRAALWTIAAAAGTVAAAEMPVVQVVGQRSAAFDAAGAGTVDAARIASRPALRTGQLLEFVPGLAVTQHSGDGKANQYFLRGFDLDHGTDFATFVDGVPVNLRSHAHGQGYTDLNFVIPELVRRIDYRKGPYGAADGDFASAGSARMELKDALPEPVASATVGGDGFRRALAAGSGAVGGGTLLYGLDVQRNDGPWQVPEGVRRMSAVLRWSAGGRTDGHAVTAMAYRNRWRATDQIPLRAQDAIGRFGTVDPTDGGHATRYSVAYARRAGPFTLNAYAVRSSLDLYSNFTYALERPEQGDQFRQAERRTLLGLDAAWGWRGTLAGLDLHNQAGVQLRHDRVAPVGLATTVARRITDTVREDGVREASAAVYAESAVQWTPWLRTIAGLRADGYRFSTGARRAMAGIATPKLSVIAGPFFFHAGQGFHSNDARGVVAGVTPLVRTRGVEAGVRAEPVAGLVTSLSAWRLRSGAELVYAGDTGTTEPSRASRRHGIEWSSGYTAGPLRLDLDVALSRARYTDDGPDDGPAGSAVPGALERMISAGATYAPAGGWSAAITLRHLGPRALTEDGVVRSRGSTLADARIGYRFGPRTQLALDVFNLFDRQAREVEYYYASRLPGEGAARQDIHFHPAVPRTFRLTLTQAF